MEQNTPHLCLYCNESIFRLLCHSNDRIELCFFGYDRNCGRSRVSIYTYIVITKRKMVFIIIIHFDFEFICWCIHIHISFFVGSDLVSLFPIQFTSKILCLNRFGKHILIHTDKYIHNNSVCWSVFVVGQMPKTCESKTWIAISIWHLIKCQLPTGG